MTILSLVDDVIPGLCRRVRGELAARLTALLQNVGIVTRMRVLVGVHTCAQIVLTVQSDAR